MTTLLNVLVSLILYSWRYQFCWEWTVQNREMQRCWACN